MNRRQRRAAGYGKRVRGGYLIGDPELLAALDLHCPDCASELHHYTDHDGIPHVEIHHDDTCPTWAQIQR